MRVNLIVSMLEDIYKYNSFNKLKEITSGDFQYISDFEDNTPMSREEYEKYLKEKLENFQGPHSLEIVGKQYSKNLIEINLEKNALCCLDKKTSSEKLNFYPFLKERLLQCELKDEKIWRMHLCSPENQRIPENIQSVLLESCKRNDFNAAKKAIENGAYAGDCRDGAGRSCIFLAAEFGSVELCRLLMEDDAGIKYGDDWLTVYYAINNPNIEVLKFLIQQNVSLDVVCDFMKMKLPMAPLDYARYIHNEAAEKLLQDWNAPTYEEMKEWCFHDADLKIRLSEEQMDGGDMSMRPASEEVDEEYSWFHIGKSKQILWMELDDCWDFIVPFFSEYCSTEFGSYGEENLIVLGEARKALPKIRKFIELLEQDFDNQQVRDILGKRRATSFIEWGERSSMCGWYFSDKENFLLWKAHRYSLIVFYREFCEKMEAMMDDAEKCGDCYICFEGP